TSAVTLTAARITCAPSSQCLTLSWPTDHTGWRLQVQTNSLSRSNWFNLPNSTATNQIILTIDPNITSLFYRLIYPCASAYLKGSRFLHRYLSVCRLPVPLPRNEIPRDNFGLFPHLLQTY